MGYGGVGCGCESISWKFQVDIFIFGEVLYDLGVNGQLPRREARERDERERDERGS